jgi:hypothetical protein
VPKILLIALGLTLSAAFGLDAHANTRERQTASDETLYVRVYHADVFAAADLDVIHGVAADVLAASGIGLRWLDCDDRNSPVAAASCETPLAAMELAVRFVRLPSDSSRRQIELGYALVDSRAGAGKLATIFADRVQWLADQAGVDPLRLVGFAVVHELGHLLLGTGSHGGSGLMRAVWSRADLQRGRSGDWLFAPSEAARIRSRLRAAHRELRIADF